MEGRQLRLLAVLQEAEELPCHPLPELLPLVGQQVHLPELVLQQLLLSMHEHQYTNVH
jgi:hypothetical protein